MHSLTAGRPRAALEGLEDTDAPLAEAVASEPLESAVDEVQGLPEPAIIEVSASLGELALFVSGRVCEDWWPPVVSSLLMPVVCMSWENPD